MDNVPSIEITDQEHRRDNLGRFVKGNPSYGKGRPCSPETIRTLSEARFGSGNPMFGKKPWNKGKTPPQCQIEQQRESITQWHREHPGAVAGENHPGWRGGRLVSKKGYVKLWRPEHPFCDGKGYVFEHRLVMEASLGCFLKRCELVHHINGNPSDNALSNLQLCSRSEHTRIHKRRKS